MLQHYVKHRGCTCGNFSRNWLCLNNLREVLQLGWPWWKVLLFEIKEAVTYFVSATQGIRYYVKYDEKLLYVQGNSKLSLINLILYLKVLHKLQSLLLAWGLAKSFPGCKSFLTNYNEFLVKTAWKQLLPWLFRWLFSWLICNSRHLVISLTTTGQRPICKHNKIILIRKLVQKRKKKENKTTIKKK